VAGGILLASQFLAGGLLLVLAVTLLAIKFGSRVNRAFALYLLLEGATILLVNIGRLNGETQPEDLWLRLAYYPLIVLPLALLHFLLVYRHPVRSRAMVAASVALAVIALGLLVFHAVDSCAYACTKADGREAGPLLAFAGLKPLFQAGVAFLLVLDVRRGTPARGKAVYLVAVAFGLLAAFDAGLGVLRTIAGPWEGDYVKGAWIFANRSLQFLALAVALLTFVLAGRTISGDSDGPRAARLPTGMLVGALASAALIVSLPDSTAGSFATFLAGFWRTLLPAVIAYALIRHRLFGIEVKIRASVAFALVAAVFGGTYFLVSEGLEAVVSERYGTIGGLAAAALLTVLAKPITAVAKRVAAFLIPAAPLPTELPPRKGAAIYRAQFALFQQDGELSEKERRLLDNLRVSLGVSSTDARRIEREASLRD
jgi:hypothetical protein